KIKEIITLTELKPLTYNNIRGYLGLAYDSEYEWSDTKIYCSELVAKLLNIKPRPMYFDSKLWPDYYSQYQGMPGISPDALYWLLSHSIRIGRLYGNTSSL